VSQEHVEKTYDFIAAYNRRDFDAAVQFFDPEIDWVLPEHQRFDSCKGREEVRRFWEELDETFEELRLDPQEAVDAGDRVAVRLRFTTRSPRFAMEASCGPSTSRPVRKRSKPPGLGV
jgi:ketosteroid isomerase-like protein